MSAAVAVSHAASSVQPQYILRTGSIPADDAASAAKLVSLPVLIAPGRELIIDCRHSVISRTVQIWRCAVSAGSV